jgi:hypothetical protein
VNVPRRLIIAATIVSALVVFCVVQDRVTAAGVRRYVSLQREALAGRGPVVTIEAVMTPAVRSSLRQALLWGGVVLLCGFALAVFARADPRSAEPPNRC